MLPSRGRNEHVPCAREYTFVPSASKHEHETAEPRPSFDELRAEHGVLTEQSGERRRAVGAEEETGGGCDRRDRLRGKLQVWSRRRGRRSLCLDARRAGRRRSWLQCVRDFSWRGEVVVQERRTEQDEGVRLARPSGASACWPVARRFGGSPLVWILGRMAEKRQRSEGPAEASVHRRKSRRVGRSMMRPSHDTTDAVGRPRSTQEAGPDTPAGSRPCSSPRCGSASATTGCAPSSSCISSRRSAPAGWASARRRRPRSTAPTRAARGARRSSAGFVADRLIGQHYAVLLGGILIALGHFTLAFNALAGVLRRPGAHRRRHGPAQAQREHDRRLALRAGRSSGATPGFSIFYMGINSGGLIGQIVAGYIAQKINWHAGFATRRHRHGVRARSMRGCGRERLQQGLDRLAKDKASRRQTTTSGGRCGADARRVDPNPRHLHLLRLCVAVLGRLRAGRVDAEPVCRSAHTAFSARLGVSLVVAAGRAVGVRDPVCAGHGLAVDAPPGASSRRARPSSRSACCLSGLAFVLLMPAGTIAETGLKVSPLWLIAAYAIMEIGELCLSPVGAERGDQALAGAPRRRDDGRVLPLERPRQQDRGLRRRLRREHAAPEPVRDRRRRHARRSPRPGRDGARHTEADGGVRPR